MPEIVKKKGVSRKTVDVTSLEEKVGKYEKATWTLIFLLYFMKNFVPLFNKIISY